MAKKQTLDAAAARRTRQLAAIHVMATKQLGLDREAYVDVLRRVAGVESAAALDGKGRTKVLDELRRLAGGKAPRRAHQELADTPPSFRPELQAMASKIGAMLAEADRTWAYAHGIAQRMFKVARVEWLTAHQMHDLVAALAYDQNRRGSRK